MKICMVSSESVPFSKSGGLADVVGALSKALASLGEEVLVVLPHYGFMTDELVATDIEHTVSLLGSEERVTYAKLSEPGVEYYFVRHPFFTESKGIYGPTSSSSYDNNHLRYTLQSKASLKLLKILGWKPDIIHAHDWPAGFLPYLVKQDSSRFFKNTKTVFSIHNLAYQGEVSRLDLIETDIEVDPLFFVGSGSEKRANMLKTGLEFADTISTVSPTYAKEIQTPEYGCGLEELLQRRKDDLVGIINGIDIEEWNPENDRLLDYSFSIDDLSNKARLKRQIQEEFNLEVNADIPLFAMISRLVSQKGFVELLEGEVSALEELLTTEKIQVVVLGTGDWKIEKQFTELGSRFKNLSVNILFSNRAAHLLEAGSDFFLMPSRYEPCGLNQFYSLRYGTLPIARRTGGLADSITDLDENPQRGTGILFDSMSGRGILEAVRRALAWWKKGRSVIEPIQKRAMAYDSSWTRSARSYQELYRKTQGGVTV